MTLLGFYPKFVFFIHFGQTFVLAWLKQLDEASWVYVDDLMCIYYGIPCAGAEARS